MAIVAGPLKSINEHNSYKKEIASCFQYLNLFTFLQFLLKTLYCEWSQKDIYMRFLT